MIVVLDTNVLVSALLRPFGPPARVLDLDLAGEVRLAYDDRLLAEYRQVLARPRFGLVVHDVTHLLDYLAADGLPVVARPLAISLPDPDDLPFLEVAVEAGAVLVTGNRRHFPAEVCGDVRVLTPADFLAQWPNRRDHL
jgi:putative PIN family toxin of toxin-antitoxin system